MVNIDLLENFKTNLLANELIQYEEKMVLAVSGGLDSVALLHLFSKIQNELKLILNVVHVHHGIRGKEADRDLEFVQSLSARYQLPFYFRKVEAIKFAAEAHLSLEESARILRYQVFDEILKETRSTKLATAHTADDQAETIIDHFLRGSGIPGMRGMATTRGPYIRPLLTFHREELEVYVTQNRLNYCKDSSNDDLTLKRNRIRKQLIPYLKEHFNPNLLATLIRSGHIFKENEAFLNAYANKAFKSLVFLHKKNEIILDIDGFLNYFEIIKKYIIFQVCDVLSISRNDLSFEKLERILSLIKQRKIGKKIALNKEFEINIDHDGIVITKCKKPFTKVKLNLLKDGTCKYHNYEFRWSIIDHQGGINLENKGNVEFVDFDRTGSQVYLRTLQPGDRFMPLHFTGQKKVADYFSDKKIPHHVRTEIPILEASKGIVWICGLCIDDRFKITTKTTRLLKMEIIEQFNAT